LNLYFQPRFSEQDPVLTDSELHHAKTVLRIKTGEPLQVTNGKGLLFDCTYNEHSQLAGKIQINKVTAIPKPLHKIHIGLAIIKASDRMEWFVEKATEIGIQKISFFVTSNCERKNINTDRLEKVAISALKQSGQTWLPEIIGPVRFEHIIESAEHCRFIGYIPNHLRVKNLLSLATSKQTYLVLIGPEGDFTEAEYDIACSRGFQPVSLGKNTLRTETAALAACQILNLVQE
jgi:16S rRNA (uracil1498-N3)-methyltransferase